jgi:hypothetical protein
MLTETQQALLDFEAQRFLMPGRKAAEIRARFDMTELRYYQQLNRLLDEPAATVYAPQLVHRLRRLRAGRARVTTASRR